MTSPEIRSATPHRNALYELALAMQVPDAGVLDEFVRRYPDHAEGLTDLAIELAMESLADAAGAEPEGAASGVSVSVAMAMSRFQNRLYQVQKEAASQRASRAGGTENPFASLDRDGIRDFGHRLNASNVFVMKLRDRQIDEATMTPGFKNRVATELRAPIDVVLAHFASGTQVQRATHFKSDQKPVAGAKQTFEEALRSSGLSDEQQRYLRGL
jgi:hypothetical protein